MMCCNENSPLYLKKTTLKTKVKEKRKFHLRWVNHEAWVLKDALQAWTHKNANILYFYTFIKHFPVLHMSIICYFYSKIREKNTFTSGRIPGTRTYISDYPLLPWKTNRISFILLKLWLIFPSLIRYKFTYSSSNLNSFLYSLYMTTELQAQPPEHVVYPYLPSSPHRRKMNNHSPQ